MTKQEMKNQAFFYFGLIIGISAGVAGNIFVSSANNFITNSCKNDLCFWGSGGLMVLSFILFAVLIFWIFNTFKKIIKKLK